MGKRSLQRKPKVPKGGMALTAAASLMAGLNSRVSA